MIPKMGCALVGLFLAVGVGQRIAGAQANVSTPGTENAPGTTEVKEIVLDLTRQKLSLPLFRYRLLPMVSELNSGDAAPVYLRLNYQTRSENIDKMDLKAAEWLAQPLDNFPTAEAKLMVEQWSNRLRQIEFGTRRQSCHWDYTVLEEKDNPFEILLPDAQSMRTWCRLLAVKMRVEIAEGQAEEAIRTLKTSIAFGRHVAEGPFYINKLVGIAIINVALGLADELIGQPGTPNLYWALTALPQPLVGIREAIENERASMGRALTGQLLDEIDLSRRRSDPEWAALLADLHARMVRLDAFSRTGTENPPPPTPDLSGFKATMLPKAREYLKARQIAATSADQELVQAIIGLYRELADENFKIAYMDYPDSHSQQTEIAERLKAAESGPAAVFARVLPNVQAFQLATVRQARKIAALRVIEALRLYAAEHDGNLPNTLDQVNTVPIPLDPLTGQAFKYRREGVAAIVTGPSPISTYRLGYRIKVRP